MERQFNVSTEEREFDVSADVQIEVMEGKIVVAVNYSISCDDEIFEDYEVSAPIDEVLPDIFEDEELLNFMEWAGLPAAAPIDLQDEATLDHFFKFVEATCLDDICDIAQDSDVLLAHIEDLNCWLG